MNCRLIQAWFVEISDGYTSRPVAYFSSKNQAELYLKSQRDHVYMSVNTKSVPAVEIQDVLGKVVWLLGAKIDLDHTEEKKREELINKAKSKLNPEELAALLGK